MKGKQVTLIRTHNVTGEQVRPRDKVAVRDARVASVSHTEEFHVTIRFDNQRPLRVAKCAVVTVYREDRS